MCDVFVLIFGFLIKFYDSFLLAISRPSGIIYPSKNLWIVFICINIGVPVKPIWRDVGGLVIVQNKLFFIRQVRTTFVI